jgi:hypothetical protein
MLGQERPASRVTGCVTDDLEPAASIADRSVAAHHEEMEHNLHGGEFGGERENQSGVQRQSQRPETFSSPSIGSMPLDYDVRLHWQRNPVAPPQEPGPSEANGQEAGAAGGVSEAGSAAGGEHVDLGQEVGIETGDGTSDESGDQHAETGGGYRAAEAAAAEAVRVIEALDGIRAEMQLISERQDALAGRLDALDARQLQEARHVTESVQRLQDIVDAVLAGGRGQDPGTAFSAQQQAAALTADVKSARKRWHSQRWDAAWEWVKKLSRRLWSMLSHLLTVKEWTVTGQVGTGPWGLASAGISVTFG